MTHRRDFLAPAVMACAGAVLPSFLYAQSFPARPVHIVVPYPPGGAADTLVRLLATQLEQRLRQTVVVDYKPGGGTVIGTAAVAKSPPDGYTLLIVANSLVINVKLHNNLPYDGMKALEWVALLATSPQVIAVNSASPYRTLKEWIDAARAQPATLSLATVGPATTQHIAGEMLQYVAGIKLVYVPFAGGALAVNAALGGHVTAIMANLSEVATQIEAGKLRALAVTTAERLDALKQVPTVAESGYPGYEATVWFGVCAPAGTPRDIVATLSDAFAAGLKDPDLRARVITAGLQPAYLGPSAFSAHVGQMYERYSKVIDDARIKAD
jgi:tripartite-type tricarboxylate transporter receptor subunit TctC